MTYIYKKLSSTNAKGFTLIELLVVIAIIGLLSTMAVVSLNSARGKARDAKRVSDIKQISNLVEMAAANTASGAYNQAAVFPAGCDAALEKLSACTIEDVDLSTIVDPIAGGSGTACDSGVTDTCTYAVSANPTVTTYELCFFLEEGAGAVAEGLNNVGEGGIITAGCN